MKRCPKCSFLYLDTDEVCDLDGTPLGLINDVDLENKLVTSGGQSVAPPNHTKRRLSLLVALIAAMLIGGLAFGGYIVVSTLSTTTVNESEIAKIESPLPVEPLPSRIPATTEPVPSPTVRATPSPSPRSTRAVVSNSPVSTSASRTDGSSQVTIRLSNGVRIEADEVWRTKDGVWYRRNGMVTLLKNNQVKSIEKGR